jgi:cell wall-associated NlpC family hydrolase
VQTVDGGYALAGKTLSLEISAGSWDFWLVKTDSAGNIMWNKTYGGTSGDKANALVQTNDGAYALAGETFSFGAGSDSDFWLVKTDGSGTMEWNKTYGGTGYDEAYALVQTSDGGYALAGQKKSFIYYDFWLVKVARGRATELAKSTIGARYQFGACGYCYDRKTFVLREDIILNGYGWNWNAPTQYGTGLDCSGLIFWSYNRAAGVVTYSDSLLPRTANGQYEATQPIVRTDLKPGDLLFFDAYRDSRTGGYSLPGQDGHIDHVAMYVGEYQYSGSILGKTYSGTYNVVEASGLGAVIPGTVDTIIARIQGAYGKNAFVGFGRVKEASAPAKMQVVGNSPIDLNVTDPDGFTVTKTADEAGDLFYREFDLDGDGELEDVVYSWEQKLGDYLVTVIPEAGAAPNDTYTIEILTDNATAIVAQNVSISDIPDQPYIITSNETTLIPRLDPYDIGITQFITPKTVVGQNFSLSAALTIFNYGNSTETFSATIYANTTSIATFTDFTITSRNSTTLNFSWNTTDCVTGNYTLSAYAWPVPSETYTSDNNFTSGWVVVSMVGDLTGGGHSVWDFVPDGAVDGSDLIVAAMCFGSYPGVPPPYKWNANCDITNDGSIDGSDLIIIARHFGEISPYFLC